MTTLTDWFQPEERYCFFCGAGFSKWAVGLPTAYELFDFKIQTYGPREGNKLNKIRELKIEWDKKNPISNAEEFIGYLIDLSSVSRKLIIWYIARRLADPFVDKTGYFVNNNKMFAKAKGRRVMGIDDRRKGKISGIKKTESFFNQLSRPNFNGIITTNYDLLIEYALGTKKFFYGDRPRLLYGPKRAYLTSPKDKKPVYLKGSIPVVKLHGSISLTEKGYCADSRGCINGKAIIVPPAHDKKISDVLIHEWNYARKILKDSRMIIFFGFRFNDYDQELINLFKETESWMQKVILINTNSDIKTLAQKIWPTAEIVWIHPSDSFERKLNSII